jgi:hypothetical protein
MVMSTEGSTTFGNDGASRVDNVSGSGSGNMVVRTKGSTGVRNDGIATSGTLWGRQRHRHGDNACRSTVSLARGRGRWWHVRRARPGSGMMTRRLWGGLDDGVGSGEVNDDACSKVNYGSLMMLVKTSGD